MKKSKSDEIFLAIVMKRVVPILSQLYERWQDEKQYEDIDTYALPLNKVLKEFKLKVAYMQKSPFGFAFAIGKSMFIIEVRASKSKLSITAFSFPKVVVPYLQ